jgi:3-oxoacyl-[acyl-carrier-protein] synthase-3
MSVGILGLGSYLPPVVRRNDWWSPRVVETWVEKQEIRSLSPHEREAMMSKLTPGQRRVVAANEALAADPFRGSLERRIMPDDMLSSQMETVAAENAIRDAGIDKAEIDLVIVQSVAPDLLHVPNACAVHRNLGLSRNCHTMSMEMVCNSFLHELALAEASIQSGRAKCAQIVQSAALMPVKVLDKQGSAWLGDGAAAVIVGAVRDDLGLKGIAHATYGEYYGVLCNGIPGKRWYDGKPGVYVPDRDGLRRKFMDIPDQAQGVVGQALKQARLTSDDVSFLSSHQATAWLPTVVKEHLELRNARCLDTFKQTASLNGANLPFILETARREGMLRDGDVVAMFSGAAGVTVSGAVLRWGRG